MNHFAMEQLGRDHIRTLLEEAAYRGQRRRRTSRRTIVTFCAAVVVGLALSTPASATNATTDRIEDFESVVAVRFEDDFPIRSLMRADCAFVQRVERPGGSSRETMSCDLSDDPVMIPEFQGVPPERAVRHEEGPCVWISDYWAYKTGATVYAECLRLVVTPAGKVHATSTYPPDPLDCE
jgi:hypothetical protein